MASNQRYMKISKNEFQVFIDDSVITDDQYNQIMSEDISLALKRVIVPKLKIRKVCLKKVSKRSNVTACDNSRLVLNYKNESNDANIALNRPKRRLRSDSVRNDCNQKKVKCNFKPIGKTSLNLNISDDNQKKNKENKNNCNIELSRVIGLPNMGNTCYINSIIQVLRMTPGFRQFVCCLNKRVNSHKSGIKLKPSNKRLISSLHNIFVHFGNNEVNINKTIDHSTNESKINDLIECEIFKNRFEFGQQQDCHEFLNWLINELNSFAELLFPHKNSSKKLAKSTYNTRQQNSLESMTFQSFQGVMLRNIECSECNRVSFTHDSFADIQIPLCVNEEVCEETDICESQTFTEIIHKKDYLKDDNKFDCDNCSKKTNAFVVNSIKIPPKVLIIFIKKPFEYNQINTRNVKPMKKLFKVPLRLEYSSSEHSIHYSLYGFVMHNGSDIDNGHYYAVIDSGVTNQTADKKKSECSCAANVTNNEWIKVNDHKVNKLNTSHLKRLLDNDNITLTPYLAFYKRID